MGKKGSVPGKEKENREGTQMIKNTTQLSLHVVFKPFSIRWDFTRSPTASANTASVSVTQKMAEAPHPDLESMGLIKVECVATSQSQASDLLVPVGQSGKLN